MAIELSTAGIKFGRVIGQSGNTPPSSGYVRLRGTKAIPSFNQEPETLEVTDLYDTEYRRYIPGLKDVGGSLAFTVNLSQEFYDDWQDILDEQTAAADNNQQFWWEVWIPGLDNGFFFRGEASPLGMPEAGVNAVLETDAYITPTYIHGWQDAIEPTEPTVTP